MQTEEEVGRQHPGMGKPRVRQVPEGSEEQGKMELTGCEIICGAPTTLMVKGLNMMMMMSLTEKRFAILMFINTLCPFLFVFVFVAVLF